MDTIIEYNTGATLSLVKEGYITQDLLIRPIEHKSSSVNVDGRPGVVRESIDYGARVIILPIVFIAKDQLDFALRRDKLFSILSTWSLFISMKDGQPTRQVLMSLSYLVKGGVKIHNYPTILRY